MIDDQVVAPTIRERVTAAGLSDDTPAAAGRHTQVYVLLGDRIIHYNR